MIRKQTTGRNPFFLGGFLEFRAYPPQFLKEEPCPRGEKGLYVWRAVYLYTGVIGKKNHETKKIRTYIHTYIHTYNTNLLLRLGSKLRSNASASYLGREIESYANLIVDAQDPDSLWLHQLAVAALKSLVRRQAGRVVRFRFVHSS